MKLRHLTLRQLEVFATVARHRNYRRAAEELHLSQPAVSLQIRQLTQAVGRPLLETRARETRLTAPGEALLRFCERLDDAWCDFGDAIADQDALRTGHLRVAVVTTAKYFLPRRLGQFCRRYPGIDVELEVANRERMLERLRENRDDLYVMGLPPDDQNLICHPFLENRLVVIGPADHPLASRATLTLDELQDEPFIHRESGSGTRRTVDAHLAALQIRLKAKLALASNEAIREAVAGGMGFAILSEYALGPALSDSNVAVYPVEGFPLHRHWYVVHPRARPLPAPARAFLAELLAPSSATAA